MLATCGSKRDVSKEVCASWSEPQCTEVARQLSLMLQSANCVFPQVALFLNFKELVRLGTVSKEIIPEDWEKEVWLSVANNACRGFRSFRLSNLDKQTIMDFMSCVVYTTPVFDISPIVVDSRQTASELAQFRRQIATPIGSSGMTFLARFQFEKEELQKCVLDSSEAAYSFPVIFDIGGSKCLIELALHNNALKLSAHNYSKEELCNCEDDDDDDDEDVEPLALSQPLHVQLRSMSSPVVLRNEYVLTYADVDVPGYGFFVTPSSPEIMTNALVEGVLCMVSVAEKTLDELDVLRLEGRFCC